MTTDQDQDQESSPIGYDPATTDTALAPWLDPDSIPKVVPGAIRADGTPTPRRRKQLKKWVRATNQQFFLRLYFACGSVVKASARARVPYKTIEGWKGGDLAFKEEMGGIKTMWGEIRELRMVDRENVALDVLDKVMAQTKDLRLAAEVAMKLLRSRGLMPDKGVVEHVGSGGGPIRVLVVDVERPPAHPVLDVESRLIPLETVE